MPGLPSTALVAAGPRVGGCFFSPLTPLLPSLPASVRNWQTCHVLPDPLPNGPFCLMWDPNCCLLSLTHQVWPAGLSPLSLGRSNTRCSAEE